jgi:hypothetical protein
MATLDITRRGFDPKKMYSGVRMQQGRVLTDDDFNTQAEILAESSQKITNEIVGPFGSSNDGFLIKEPTVNEFGIDFKICKGSLYVAGKRIELLSQETFQLQRDWLQLTPNATPANSRYDLVYIEMWEKAISAVEDNEQFETGLGGPDTAQRSRLIKRLAVAEDTANTCHDAWHNLLATWEADGWGIVENYTRRPDTAITVGFVPNGLPDDLCHPQATDGYLGAENQALRVQLIDDSHFSWSYDNTTALHRARIDADRVTIHVDTEFKDHYSWPKAGQVVEILPWGGVLANGEKTAQEIEPGYFAKIENGYNPDEHTFSLVAGDAVPPGWGEEWTARVDSTDLEKRRYGTESETPFVYIRIWNRGPDVSSPAAIPIVAGENTLGTTGLTVTFDGDDRIPGDYWVIAARPQTRDQVTPWELEVGREPHGYIRYVAPLALIHWTVIGDSVDGEVVHDCRPRFRPLTHQNKCCTFIVGDGEISFGDFTSIQAAIDQLPEGGGKIVVLEGIYEEQLKIEGKQNIIIEGCGDETVILSDSGSSDPLISIIDCDGVTLKSFKAVHETGPVVLNHGLEKVIQGFESESLILIGRDSAAWTCYKAVDISLSNSLIEITSMEKQLGEGLGQISAVYAQGENISIDSNTITVEVRDRSTAALGGLQIGGGSSNVYINNNVVDNGNGNGITLGSLLWVPESIWGDWEKIEDWISNPFLLIAILMYIDPAGCIIWDPDPSPTDENGDPLIPLSSGDLLNVTITDNIIKNMGANGISVVHFFELEKYSDFITVDKLFIQNNTIESCLQIEFEVFPSDRLNHAAYAGIALADGEDIQIYANRVENNGNGHDTATCGVFILNGEAVMIEGNHVRFNGPNPDTTDGIKPGNKGGIVLPFVRPTVREVSFTTTANQTRQFFRQNGTPAARIHDNVVVSFQGKALKVMALGPLSIENNQFTSRGSDIADIFKAFIDNANSPEETGLKSAGGQSFDSTGALSLFIDLLGGSAVQVLNLGMSLELYLQLGGFGGVFLPDDLLNLADDDQTRSQVLLANGNIQFNGNQVTLDAIDSKITLGLSSVLLLSLDDIGFTNNQSDCALFTDFVFINTLALGWSMRQSDNRFKEGVANALLSVASFGLMNQTSENQGSHCFFTVGMPQLSHLCNNRTLMNARLTPISDQNKNPGCCCWGFDELESPCGKVIKSAEKLSQQLGEFFEKRG